MNTTAFSRSASTHRLAALIQLTAATIAFWPVWIWYYESIRSNADEPLGLLALLTLVFLSWNKISFARTEAIPPESWFPSFAPLLLMLVYCCSFALVPHIVSSVMAVAVIGFCAFRGTAFRSCLGEIVLLFLSLPLMSSMNFYLGYPLRVLASNCASVLLNIGGLSVSNQGAEILFNNSTVGIDPPCSGIKMLWVGVYLAAALATWMRLSFSRTFSLLLVSFLTVLAANSLRVSALFYIESGILNFSQPLHSIVHAGIGAVVFAVSALIISWSARNHERRQFSAEVEGEKVEACEKGEKIEESEKADKCKKTEKSRSARKATKAQRPIESTKVLRRVQLCCALAFLLACTFASVIPLLPQNLQAEENSAVQFGGWPDELEGQKLDQIPLSKANEVYAQSFPGKIAVFGMGKSRVVYRWIAEASRQVHPSATCYKFSAYEIKYLPPIIDEDHQKWECFEATKGTEKLKVRERLFDERGRSWSDVSSWYWSAILGKSQAPWYLVSVTERIE